MIDRSYFFKHIPRGIFEDLFEKELNLLIVLTKKETIQKKISSMVKGKVHSSVITSKNVFIGEKTVIEPYCIIEGPVYIGKNCFARLEK